MRDIIHPINESEALDFGKTTGLNPIDYKRFRLALEHYQIVIYFISFISFTL